MVSLKAHQSWDCICHCGLWCQTRPRLHQTGYSHRCALYNGGIFLGGRKSWEGWTTLKGPCILQCIWCFKSKKTTVSYYEGTSMWIWQVQKRHDPRILWIFIFPKKLEQSSQLLWLSWKILYMWGLFTFKYVVSNEPFISQGISSGFWWGNAYPL